MATATKEKNGATSANAVADALNQATQEAKAVSDVFVNATNKAAEEVNALVNTQQKFLQDGFNTYQQYSQAYFDFALGAFEQSSAQWFGFYERFGELAKGNFKKGQELITVEQNFALNAVESFYNQAQTASDRFTKLFS
jgi:hypothetical protein